MKERYKYKKYEMMIRGKWSIDDCSSIDEIIGAMNFRIERLRKMALAGITLREKVEDDYGYLETDDPAVAEESRSQSRSAS